MSFRNDSLKSKARITVNEKRREFIHKNYSCLEETHDFELRLY